jgi:hypothetical protein
MGERGVVRTTLQEIRQRDGDRPTSLNPVARLSGHQQRSHKRAGREGGPDIAIPRRLQIERSGSVRNSAIADRRVSIGAER